MATTASLVLGAGASTLGDIFYLIRAGELPQHPIELAYKHFVYEPTKREIMRSIAAYMAKRTADAAYNKVKEKVKSTSKNIQRVAKKLPWYLQNKVANRIKALGDEIDLGALKPEFVVEDLRKVQDYTVQKAKEFGIISKKYSDEAIEKIRNLKRIVKYAKEKGWTGTIATANQLLKEVRKEGQSVFTDKVPSDGTEYLGIAELFKQNSTNPVAVNNSIVEEEILVPVPEGEMVADFTSGNKGIIDQNAKKRLREPILINEVDLPGPKERESVIDDVSDLVDAALGRRKKIKLSKGAKIAKGLLNGDLPSQFSNISISDVPTVINRVNKANRQKLHYNTFRAGRSNDYIPTQTMVNFLKNKF